MEHRVDFKMCDVCFCSNHCTSITTLYWNKTHNVYHSTWSAHMYTVLFVNPPPLNKQPETLHNIWCGTTTEKKKRRRSSVKFNALGTNTLNRSHESFTVPWATCQLVKGITNVQTQRHDVNEQHRRCPEPSQNVMKNQLASGFFKTSKHWIKTNTPQQRHW